MYNGMACGHETQGYPFVDVSFTSVHTWYNDKELALSSNTMTYSSQTILSIW